LSGRWGSFAFQAGYLEPALWLAVRLPVIPGSAAAVGPQQLTVSTIPVLTFNPKLRLVRQAIPILNWCFAGLGGLAF
jgi:hypothetical protein